MYDQGFWDDTDEMHRLKIMFSLFLFAIVQNQRVAEMAIKS